MFLDFPSESSKRASAVRFEDEENEKNVDQSLERKSSLVQTSSSLPGITQQSTVSTQKLFAHQFFDVYAGMTDDEWIKVRNAFVAQYFSE